MVTKIVLFLLIMFSGGALQSVTGFGLSVYAICFLPMLMPMQQAVVVVSMMAAVASIRILVSVRGRVNVSLLLPAMAAGLLAQAIGFTMLVSMEEAILKRILGVALVLLAVCNAFFADRIRLRACGRNAVIAGLISGVLTGLYNIGGPPLVIYYLNACPDKEEYTATLQASFLVSIAVGLVMHALKGNITLAALEYGTIGALTVLPGTWLGMKLFRRLDRRMLTRLICLFLAMMGLMQLFL